MLIDVASPAHYSVLGETRDDAAGEAFDKSAKLLGLPYPGGPELARLAVTGNARRFNFPRPMVERGGLEFSFSGLKTAVSLAVKDRALAGKLDEATRADIAAGVQAAIVDTLVAKTLLALEQTGYEALVVAGGVGANRALRDTLDSAVARIGARVYYPRVEFCTDNAAMIAVAGMARLKAGFHEGPAIRARALWPLSELASS
jgi:N6-L-threonylcarbamoyladenine synthase